ncbi:MAG TPA: hypothetical protein VK540_33330 [Polyangiaceae bacterium]|jgi:hypothetical protein|nr:hypothetical protein [Polyangiaceae bacterium]
MAESTFIHPPRWLRAIAWIAAIATLLLYVGSGVLAYRADYKGIELPQSGDPCEIAGLALPADASAGDRCCGYQRQHRMSAFAGAEEALRIACKRREHFRDALEGNNALARTALKQEKGVIQESFKSLRELVGPDLRATIWKQFFLLFLTVAAPLAILYAVGRHASRIGIDAVAKDEEGQQVYRPYLLIAGASALVAGIVLGWESLDPQKSSFDWNSYCVSRASFWPSHAAVVGVALVTSAPLATGWYLTAKAYVPDPQPNEPRWGARVGKYVSFLETWMFLTVVSVGFVSAIWLHDLAAVPSRTNVISAFLGVGALGVAVLVLRRMMACAQHLREKCDDAMRADPARDKWPPDPTGHILAERWWQLPAAFLAAAAIAYTAVQTAGVSRLFGASEGVGQTSGER